MLLSSVMAPRRPSVLLRYIGTLTVLLLVLAYLSGRSGGLGTYILPTPGRPSRPSSPGGQATAAGGRDGSLGMQKDAPPQQQQQPTSNASPPSHSFRSIASLVADGTHPIDRLVAEAETRFRQLLAGESRSLADAAAAYRARRGRHPPPGFDRWYEFARSRNALVMEEFWDQIHHDLEPFWALDPRLVRREAAGFEMVVSIRAGVASTGSEWFWTQLWRDMIGSVAHLLPDMDLALNAMDEPRIVVPWEVMDRHMAKAGKTRTMAPPEEVVSDFQSLPPREQISAQTDKTFEKTLPYWRVARRGCPPDSEARRVPVTGDFDHTPTIRPAFAAAHTYGGFVANTTRAADFCGQPDLQGLEGIFVRPLTVSATDSLFPLFGGSKLATNNEILLPAPIYWSADERFDAGGDTGGAWRSKADRAMWRGVATGGKNTETNWRAFQRHRFVAMNNATKLSRAEQAVEAPANFALPPAVAEHEEAAAAAAAGSVPVPAPRARQQGRLGAWVGSWADVAFVDLMCEPGEEQGACRYTGPHFAVAEGITMAGQFAYKYLPDVDGNSFSGRYRGFLLSTSLPIKATMWREWHDSRLVAWRHFVPMDNRFGDWYGIMEYFLGYDGGGADDKKKTKTKKTKQKGTETVAVAGHDAVAEAIASEGKAWAERVLRHEDMQVYVLRLLLEYARVSDERREKMGWVGDLAEQRRREW